MSLEESCLGFRGLSCLNCYPSSRISSCIFPTGIKKQVSIFVSDLPGGRESEEQSRSLSLFLHGWGYSCCASLFTEEK